MKKIISLVLCAIMVLSCAAILTSCDSGEKKTPSEMWRLGLEKTGTLFASCGTVDEEWMKEVRSLNVTLENLGIDLSGLSLFVFVKDEEENEDSEEPIVLPDIVMSVTGDAEKKSGSLDLCAKFDGDEEVKLKAEVQNGTDAYVSFPDAVDSVLHADIEKLVEKLSEELTKDEKAGEAFDTLGKVAEYFAEEFGSFEEKYLNDERITCEETDVEVYGEVLKGAVRYTLTFTKDDLSGLCDLLAEIAENGEDDISEGLDTIKNLKLSVSFTFDGDSLVKSELDLKSEDDEESGEIYAFLDVKEDENSAEAEGKITVTDADADTDIEIPVSVSHSDDGETLSGNASFTFKSGDDKTKITLSYDGERNGDETVLDCKLKVSLGGMPLTVPFTLTLTDGENEKKAAFSLDASILGISLTADISASASTEGDYSAGVYDGENIELVEVLNDNEEETAKFEHFASEITEYFSNIEGISKLAERFASGESGDPASPEGEIFDIYNEDRTLSFHGDGTGTLLVILHGKYDEKTKTVSFDEKDMKLVFSEDMTSAMFGGDSLNCELAYTIDGESMYTLESDDIVYTLMVTVNGKDAEVLMNMDTKYTLDGEDLTVILPNGKETTYRFIVDREIGLCFLDDEPFSYDGYSDITDDPDVEFKIDLNGDDGEAVRSFTFYENRTGDKWAVSDDVEIKDDEIKITSFGEEYVIVFSPDKSSAQCGGKDFDCYFTDEENMYYIYTSEDEYKSSFLVYDNDEEHGGCFAVIVEGFTYEMDDGKIDFDGLFGSKSVEYEINENKGTLTMDGIEYEYSVGEEYIELD